MHNDIHTLAIIFTIAAVTALLRYLPFLILGKNKKTPKFIMYLGKVLPYAVMGMLVVYCLKDVDILKLSSVMPSLIAVLLTGALQYWKHNVLLSIGGGTVVYMILIQFIFA